MKVLFTSKRFWQIFCALALIVVLTFSARSYIDSAVLTPIRHRLNEDGMILRKYHANLFECPTGTKFGGSFVAKDKEGKVKKGTICIPKDGGAIKVTIIMSHQRGFKGT